MDSHGLGQKVRHKIWLLNTSVNISLTSKRNNHLLTMPTGLLKPQEPTSNAGQSTETTRKQTMQKKGNRETRGRKL